MGMQGLECLAPIRERERRPCWGHTGTLPTRGEGISRNRGKAANGVDAGAVKTSVSVLNNVVTGEGAITYIAQNGIQVSFGVAAKLVGNVVSLNRYTPAKVTACGLLLYKAGGVSASKAGLSYVKAENDFHNNEANVCNFGKGGTSVKP
jgi:hypothetical protein